MLFRSDYGTNTAAKPLAKAKVIEGEGAPEMRAAFAARGDSKPGSSLGSPAKPSTLKSRTQSDEEGEGSALLGNR